MPGSVDLARPGEILGRERELEAVNALVAGVQAPPNLDAWRLP
jgi:hypothetical protein